MRRTLLILCIAYGLLAAAFDVSSQPRPPERAPEGNSVLANISETAKLFLEGLAVGPLGGRSSREITIPRVEQNRQ